MNDTRHKGEIAQLKVQLRAAEKGFICSQPCMDGCRYDLIIDDGQRLYRVQVKYGNAKSTSSIGCSRVSLFKRNSGGKGGSHRYTADEIDAVLVYLPCAETIVWLPPEVFESRDVVHIRTEKSLNGQSKGMLHASDYRW